MQRRQVHILPIVLRQTSTILLLQTPVRQKALVKEALLPCLLSVGLLTLLCVSLTTSSPRSPRWKWPPHTSVAEHRDGIWGAALSALPLDVSMTAVFLGWPLATQRIDSFRCQVRADKGQLSGEWLCSKPLCTALSLHQTSMFVFDGVL